jgi:hypothetical protein
MQLNTTETLSAATLPKFSVPVRPPFVAESFSSKLQREVGTTNKIEPRQSAEVESAAPRKAAEEQNTLQVLQVKSTPTPPSDSTRSDRQIMPSYTEGRKQNRNLQPNQAASSQANAAETTKIKPKVASTAATTAKPPIASKLKHAALTINSNPNNLDEAMQGYGGVAVTQRDAGSAKDVGIRDQSTPETIQKTMPDLVATKSSKTGTSAESANKTKLQTGPTGGSGAVVAASGSPSAPIAMPDSSAPHGGRTTSQIASAAHTSSHAEASSPTPNSASNFTPATGIDALSPSHPAKSSARMNLQLPAAASRTTQVMVPQVIASSPASLDVGVFDSTHGWLKIRAELGRGGAVSASLTTSASAHESVRAALPQMASYLGSEAVSVSKIALHRFGESSNATSTATGGQQSGDGAGDKARHNAPRESGASGYESGPSGMDESESGFATAATASVPWGVDGRSLQGGSSAAAPWLSWLRDPIAASSGSWLNVSA